MPSAVRRKAASCCAAALALTPAWAQAATGSSIVAGILMLKQAENWGKIAYFMSAESVKWRRPVRPGDRLVVDVELTKSRGKIGKARGVCTVDGEVVSEADVAFMLMDR